MNSPLPFVILLGAVGWTVCQSVANAFEAIAAFKVLLQ
jgi:hypothetical protein